MNIVISLAAALLSGMIGAMGMGGGAVLIIYLTVFKNTEQFKAQGINLFFFVPIALFSVIVYAKKGYIRWKTVLPLSAGGLMGALAGVFAADMIGADIIKKAFGAAILLLGILEVVKGVKSLLARKRKGCYNKGE